MTEITIYTDGSCQTQTRSGILVKKTQHCTSDTPWWWISGDTYPHRETLKSHGCRWSKKRKSWYYIGADLPDAVQALTNAEPDLQETADEPQAAESKEEDKPEIIENDDQQEESSIRIIKPMLDTAKADAILDAIQQTKADNLPTFKRTTSARRNLVAIPQSPCGELTGSITGNVWCYGYAVHEGVCVYVNMGGPRMAVEAIRAKMSKGGIVNCVPWDAPSIELTAGEGNTGMYTAFMQNIPEAKFTSLILCHELLTTPNYSGKSTTFIFHISDEQAMAQLRHHVTKLVKIPVFPDWTGYLWQAGQSAMLVRPTRTGGDVRIWTVDLDADAWTRLITGGLAQNIINLPQNL
ncbi:MAG: hypothetical protein D6711_04370 [Chloroflexi bacterium]|nr:MAG: hypothetical protein D6711_04370 [Chloroflexota bacterium]